jgi:hypothetical protein
VDSCICDYSVDNPCFCFNLVNSSFFLFFLMKYIIYNTLYMNIYNLIDNLNLSQVALPFPWLIKFTCTLMVCSQFLVCNHCSNNCLFIASVSMCQCLYLVWWPCLCPRFIDYYTSILRFILNWLMNNLFELIYKYLLFVLFEWDY